MAQHLAFPGSSGSRCKPGEVKELYKEFSLAGFELRRIRVEAASVAKVDADLEVNNSRYAVTMRWIVNGQSVLPVYAPRSWRSARPAEVSARRGWLVRPVSEDGPVTNGIPGQQVEDYARRLAGDLGVRDFVYLPIVIQKGKGSREVSDGLLVAGDEGLILQVKSRDPGRDQLEEQVRRFGPERDVAHLIDL